MIFRKIIDKIIHFNVAEFQNKYFLFKNIQESCSCKYQTFRKLKMDKNVKNMTPLHSKHQFLIANVFNFNKIAYKQNYTKIIYACTTK